MSLLTIRTAPDPCLTKVALPVDSVTDEVRRLMNDMLETMYANDGAGLAANQVGVLKRVVVIDQNAGEPDLPPIPLKMANPEIFWQSEDSIKQWEACLSVPYQSGEVKRPAQVKVRYLDENNQLREIECDGFMAKCIQHEIDHLNGVLYIDHLSTLKRGIILKKLQRLKR